MQSPSPPEPENLRPDPPLVNMKHHILILLTFIVSNNAVDPFEKQFDDVDNWLYTMQAYLSSSPVSQVAGKMGPIR